MLYKRDADLFLLVIAVFETQRVEPSLLVHDDCTIIICVICHRAMSECGLIGCIVSYSEVDPSYNHEHHNIHWLTKSC